MSNSEPKKAHLFVLVHGLWGGPNHLSVVEKAIEDSLAGVGDEEVVTIRPSSFKFWKTYDGLRINGEKVLREILYELESLKEQNNLVVTKLSIVGYSLGGLISRYIVGRLYEMGVFDTVEPVFFSTFATPHLGIHFYGNNMLYKLGNFFVCNLFGKSGREMFVVDSDQLLWKMTDPDGIYLMGLKKFKRHTLMANLRNDRTVSFYTSFITQYSPFSDWKKIKLEYIDGLTEAKIGKKSTKPKFVDLVRSRIVSSGEQVQSETPRTKILRLVFIISISVLVLPWWFPIILTTSTCVSIYSMIKSRLLTLPDNKGHWTKVKESIYEGISKVDPEHARIGSNKREERKNERLFGSFKGDTSNIAENTFENIIIGAGNNEQDDGDEETAFDTVVSESESFSSTTPLKTENAIRINFDANDEAIASYLKGRPENSKESEFPLFQEKYLLDFDEIRLEMLHNLNSIDWIKIPVYVEALNAHDGMVARRGPTTNTKGTASIYLWGSLLRDFLSNA